MRDGKILTVCKYKRLRCCIQNLRCVCKDSDAAVRSAVKKALLSRGQTLTEPRGRRRAYGVRRAAKDPSPPPRDLPPAAGLPVRAPLHAQW
ncbi:unnamed protein product [Euphydryas editha]|uniref:Uncharacterized protein n=1 Tax=Euphydryas editha TaxID=104508 RepID=A0AAU9V608_EUPED|nr:unnamed protein product [Euphydryas editha]